MKTSLQGRKLLEGREGLVLHAYHDSRGILTIGYGHAYNPSVHPGDVITNARADELLSSDLARFEAAVMASVKIPLRQNEFDACVSLCYNIGENGFQGSTVVHKLNLGDRKGAADAFLMWEKPPELKGRRESERHQFLTAYP